MTKYILGFVAAILVGTFASFALDYTPVSEEGTAATATITTATIGTVNVGTSLVLTNTGTVKMAGVTCVTTNQAFINGAGATNTFVIVDGIITAVN